MKNTISIIGYFGGKENFLDGQTIKTKILYEELSKVKGVRVKKVDTYYKEHCKIKLVWEFLIAVLTSRHLFCLLLKME